MLSIDNQAFDLNNITPNKRKRAVALGNHHPENGQWQPPGAFMEVKSLAELHQLNNNQFEVTRKPPKKRSKLDTAESLQGFVNAGLNLAGPDNVVNPFEIRRGTPGAGAERPVPVQPKCFVNSALNIRGPEKEVRNPFEIVRKNVAAIGGAAVSATVHGDNASTHHSPHISRAIAIPFTPTIGCRINFANVPLESLTPCTMLAKKLVFSPAPVAALAPATTPRTGLVASAAPPSSAAARVVRPECELSVISEESLDIIAELDCYQLELENSINEAKINKRARRRSSGGGGRGGKNLMDLKNRKSFAAMLSEAGEEDAEEANEKDTTAELVKSITGSDADLCAKLTPKSLDCAAAESDNSGVDYEEIDERSVNETETKEADQLSDSEADDDGEFAFKNPAPFVRTFKGKSVRRPDTGSSAAKPEVAFTGEEDKKPSTGLRQSIRNSIRRLIKPSSSSSTSSSLAPKKSVSAEQVNTDRDEPPPSTTMFSALRQSLRRRPRQADLPERLDHDASIVCDTERKVFRQPQPVGQQRSTVSHEDLGARAKAKAATSATAGSSAAGAAATLRSSFRQTGKDVRRQVMRTMFKKSREEYQFE